MNILKFPAAYIQGKDALEEFASHTRCYGDSFLFVGSKSALGAARPKLERSFSASGGTARFELSSGRPCASEIARVRELSLRSGAQALCAVGGGGVMDVVRAVAMDLNKILIMIPTAAASDAPCTFVTVLYSEDGSEIVGDRIFHRCPDLVFVDSTVVAQAPVRLLVSGMGDALATWYEAESCVRSGAVSASETALALCRTCRELILENGAVARLAAEQKTVVPALERVVEANCFLSGVGGVNTGCAAAHGIGDYLSKLPGGHDYLHGERVMVGLVIQLLLEGRPQEDIRRVVRFGLNVGLPVSIRDLGFVQIAETAALIGQGTEKDHFVVNMSCDHSGKAIEGAVILAAAMTEQIKSEGEHTL